MKFLRLLAFPLVAALLAAAAQQHPQTTWLSLKSTNFFLLGNADEKELRKTAYQLEQFRAAFTRLFTPIERQPLGPIKVIVFKDDASYRPYKPLYQGQPAAVSGYFQSSGDVNYITLTTAWGEHNPYAVIFHELTHVYTHTDGRALPPWLSEGLAEYYSTFELAAGERKIWLGKPATQHARLLRGQQLLPLARLFSVEQYSPEYNEEDKKTFFYAQAWALTHYLMQGARQTQLRQFIQALLQGHPVEASFKQSFQTDYLSLERELREYVKRGAYPAQLVEFNEKLQFDSGLPQAVANPLSAAETQFHLGDLLWRIDRPGEAEAHLRRAVALDPQMGVAHAALGLMRLREKNFPAAKSHLQEAIAAASTDYRVHYYYAYLLNQEALDEHQTIKSYAPETARLMRTALQRVMELRPDYPDAYRMYALVNLITREQTEETIALLKRALALFPARQDLIVLLGQFYLQQERYQLTKETLTPIARDGATLNLRQEAQSYLDVVKRVEEQQARLREASARFAAEAKAEELATPPTVINRAAPRLIVKREFEGETITGLLVRADCAKGLTLTLKTGNGLTQLFTATPERVQFITFTQEMSGAFTCGEIKPPRRVAVTYRKPDDPRVKFLGEPLAVEFVKAEVK